MLHLVLLLKVYLSVLFYLIKQKRSVINKMPLYNVLFHFVALLGTAVIAIPADFNSPHAIHGHQDSKEIRSLAGPILVDNTLTDITNLTIPTISIPELNASRNAGPIVLCHVSPRPPAPPVWNHVDLIECALLIMNLLASDSADLHAWQWSTTSPLVLPWTWGVAPSCNIKINAVSPSSSDVFQRVMIAQRAALVVEHCKDNLGGTISLGPKQQFQVQVFGIAPRATE